MRWLKAVIQHRALPIPWTGYRVLSIHYLGPEFGPDTPRSWESRPEMTKHTFTSTTDPSTQRWEGRTTSFLLTPLLGWGENFTSPFLLGPSPDVPIGLVFWERQEVSTGGDQLVTWGRGVGSSPLDGRGPTVFTDEWFVFNRRPVRTSSRRFG